MNTVIVAGNCVADPELRYTPDGTPTTSFAVAVSRRVKDSTGEWKDQLDGFFDCVAWRSLAEHVADSVSKGNRVVVTGRLQQRRWEAKDGSKRTSIEIVADDVGASVRFATAEVRKSARPEDLNLDEAALEGSMAYAGDVDR